MADENAHRARRGSVVAMLFVAAAAAAVLALLFGDNWVGRALEPESEQTKAPAANSQTSQDTGVKSAGPSTDVSSLQASGTPPPIETTTPDPEPSPSKPSAETRPTTSADNRTITEARIELSNESRYVEPETIEEGGAPGFEPFVFTESGRLERDDGCYVLWTIKNNGQTLSKNERSKCSKAGGFSEAYWPSSLTIDAGTLLVEAAIRTDWGQTGRATLTLTVVPD